MKNISVLLKYALRTQSGVTTTGQSGPGSALAKKGYSTFPLIPELPESHHQIVLCHIRTLVGEHLPVCRDAADWNLSMNMNKYKLLRMCLFAWTLWHINICRLFNAKCIFIQISYSISNNLV